ncbi:T9SS type B sorting domain-containing protein [Bizionia saleffrena]|uniref:T9SS type B sorting domain-containing protein n=1 Tax=Bizionia saleffrena TaxID=291189 RepID=A0A8H2LFS7_9FLAO|nr:T9SS type B sorting domain-containing protein [Bizionia saleffrena]TYB80265.1 T9SS type B sorting domain-containing protein [Bizionia saleffrena]
MKHFIYSFFLALILSLTSANLSAQNESAFWFFGQGAGLNFNTGYPVPELNGELNTEEGCATISSKLGELLFYTDGVTVWNKNHQVMNNGTGLTGDASSTQSAIIIPKPNSASIYYIFTVDGRAGSDGLRFSEVDMTLDNDLGAITSTKNVMLISSSTEKITAVESADGESVWVIGHKWNSNEFVSYLVGATGVNTTPIISAIGSFHQGVLNNSIGYLKASPNKEKIASVKSYTNGIVEIFDFNPTTGVLTNPLIIDNFTSDDLGPYGCEFSPDSRILYVTEIIRDGDNFSKIHQYDLTAGSALQIIDSDTIIIEEEGLLGAVQQAIDGKIYVAKSGSNSIGVINSPNILGLECNYSPESVNLGQNNISSLGLPPFIQSYFFATNVFNNTCFGDTTQFSIDTASTITSISWDFGDPASGVNNFSNSMNPSHVFTAPGNYNVTITFEVEGETQILYRMLSIDNEPPVLDLPPLVICNPDDSSTTSFNLINAIPTSIQNNPDLNFSFFTTENDAITTTNPILNPLTFTTTSNTTIFVKLDTANGNGCYSINELDILLLDRPDIEEFEAVFFCDNGNTSVILDVGNLPLPMSNYSFIWSVAGETSSQITVDMAGTYTVTITQNASITTENPDGCSAIRTVVVSASSLATINAVETTGTNALIIISGLGDYEFSLDNPNGGYQNSNYFSNISPGIHTVYVRDKNNCGRAEISFSIIDFPPYFTPNGDGVNDFWQVYGVSATEEPNTVIHIFNRFGKFITEIKPSSRGWDGTYNGKPMPTSDYWFFVTLEDGRRFKNHFTLKR